MHGLSRSCLGLVINLQTHQQHDESVPRQDHVSSPPSWAAFKISAVEEVTRRARSRHRGTWITHQAGTECREECTLIIRDNKTPTAYTASFAPCDVPQVFSPCPILQAAGAAVPLPRSLSAEKKPSSSNPSSAPVGACQQQTARDFNSRAKPNPRFVAKEGKQPWTLHSLVPPGTRPAGTRLQLEAARAVLLRGTRLGGRRHVSPSPQEAPSTVLCPAACSPGLGLGVTLLLCLPAPRQATRAAPVCTRRRLSRAPKGNVLCEGSTPMERYPTGTRPRIKQQESHGAQHCSSAFPADKSYLNLHLKCF